MIGAHLAGRRLYPALGPFETLELTTSDGHSIYVERCGRMGGEPIVFLHGGPGSGCTPDQRRLFDPERFEIILFDQRGAGRSRPHGSLEANDTPRLIADMEAIRTRFGYETWRLAGGSWGATLALAYADAHPERVRGMAIYGVFLCRPFELQGFFAPDGPAASLFPEAYAEFAALAPTAERGDLITAYARLFEHPDQATREAALLAWTRYEKRLSRLHTPAAELASALADPDYVYAHSRIENWYFRNNGFIEGDALIARAPSKLAHIPLEIVSGRYDVVTPPITAWQVAQAAPRARLTIAPRSGHSVKEPEVEALFMEAITRI
ncbi:MAG: prolyl aminopeptidase [Neomegalonema sp.]|nr:prolyl aminopeptidase [Neomegalonema sp.]